MSRSNPSTWRQTSLTGTLVFLLAVSSSLAVDRSKFRTCQQTSFCRRNRHQADGSSPHGNLYNYVLQDVQFHVPGETKKDSMWSSLSRKLLDAKPKDRYQGTSAVVTGRVVNIAQPETAPLDLGISLLQDGTARVRLTESNVERVTYDPLVLHKADSWQPPHAVQWHKDGVDGLPGHVLAYNDLKVQIQDSPLQIIVWRGDQALVQLNARNFLHFEVHRAKEDVPEEAQEEEKEEEKQDDKPEKEIVGYWEDGLAIYADGTREEKKQVQEEDAASHGRQLEESTGLDPNGLWEEDFSGHKDSKPHGPTSVGMDVTFLESTHVYGIPEHASSAKLQSTHGHYQEPYRLYNLDVFEYELDEPMALYGSIPFMVSHSLQTGTVGVFWFNPTETFVDVQEMDGSTNAHWISESGVLDIFILPGPDPRSVYQQYAQLTGTTPLPPMFSLGYHQCRWNYKDEKDVYTVHGKFEELDYPYDVLWLDIEHTDGKRYFTWDKNLFPNPVEMQKKLASQGRRMVTIIDPHIKRDNNYYIHKEAKNKGLYIKDNGGTKDFDGWCWPGSSSYLDFTAAHVRQWWAEQFAFDKYQGSTPTLFTWNDMNEPSVFNGPEVSMSKDLLNLEGEEHREWHNLYGMLFQQATMEGQIHRSSNDARPFVLSRAFFAGSQKYGAIWTGDNTAEWGHLEVAAPMLLSMNSAALTFVGADVGGFFGDPDAELFTRWMQAAAFQPFFRGHAHHDSKRREPWMFDEDTLRRLRHSAMKRYALLPFWYTVFQESEETGMPTMRMMWMEYPSSPDLAGVEDQYMVGSDLMVKPITTPGTTSTEVLFPMTHLWYDAESLDAMISTTEATSVHKQTVPADIDTLPVYQRGGSIVPRKLRLRRSAMLMKHDPYTLYVALDADLTASGKLYMDDEESFGYKQGEFAKASFSADWNTKTITGSTEVGEGWSEYSESFAKDRMIERIIVMGVPSSPTSIADASGNPIEFTFDEAKHVLVLRLPGVSAMGDWKLTCS